MDEEKKNQNQEPAQPPAPLSDARKAALLRYMAILFAVAFLLVLLSLILQTHSSKSTISELSAASTSALDNAVKLQEQNRTIRTQLSELSTRQREFDAITENMREGFLIVDNKCSILSSNRSALRLLGIDGTQKPENLQI